MDSQAVEYVYLQHMTSGEVFAAALDPQQRVIASIGPLVHAELASDPVGYALSMTDEDNDWFAEHDAEWRLLEWPEVGQLRERAAERAS